MVLKKQCVVLFFFLSRCVMSNLKDGSVFSTHYQAMSWNNNFAPIVTKMYLPVLGENEKHSFLQQCSFLNCQLKLHKSFRTVGEGQRIPTQTQKECGNSSQKVPSWDCNCGPSCWKGLVQNTITSFTHVFQARV